MADIVETDKTEKGPSRWTELKLVLENCNPEWRSMVIFGPIQGNGYQISQGLRGKQVDIKKKMKSVSSKKNKPQDGYTNSAAKSPTY